MQNYGIAMEPLMAITMTVVALLILRVKQNQPTEKKIVAPNFIV